jgi:hypothetical protein
MNLANLHLCFSQLLLLLEISLQSLLQSLESKKSFHHPEQSSSFGIDKVRIVRHSFPWVPFIRKDRWVGIIQYIILHSSMGTVILERFLYFVFWVCELHPVI